MIQGWANYMRDKQKLARDLETEAAEAKSAAAKAKSEDKKDGADSGDKKSSGNVADDTDPVEDVRKRGAPSTRTMNTPWALAPDPPAAPAMAILERMDYVSALVPPVVMAVFFTGLIVTIVKSQGGANKAKEDAVVDAALVRAQGARQASGGREHDA